MTESNGSTPNTNTPDTTTPDWEKRFRAPRVSLPDWAEDAPDRSLFVSNATGTYELYAWDRAPASITLQGLYTRRITNVLR